MKQTLKHLLFGAAVIVASGTLAAYITYSMVDANAKNPDTSAMPIPNFMVKHTPAVQSGGLTRVDLTAAADKSLHAVVHIKSTEKSKTRVIQRAPDIYDYIFGDGTGRRSQVQTRPRVGFGSGVILSDDGYIVTNNHVIDGADEISVTLNDNRTFTARLVGNDSNTDLALIKIDCEEKLPFLTVGDSDELKVGEWVLAVGNPFNLTSTVTAGIVSAKARSLGVYDGGIESFIQTDAAINQGNSGGALVNANGELVGINAVLTSPTGSYAGYGFAIPSSIMTKVVSDLKEYGAVQRAVLGIQGGTLTGEFAEKENLGTVDGVYVSRVLEGGAAEKAGIEKGDVIVSFAGKGIRNMAELQEALAKSVPGSEAEITVVRGGKRKMVNAVLVNVQGNTGVLKNTGAEALGAELEPVDKETREELSIPYGLKVKSVEKGLLKSGGVVRGTIILKVNGVAMRSVDDLVEVMRSAENSNEPVLFVSGLSPAGKKVYYSIPLSE